MPAGTVQHSRALFAPSWGSVFALARVCRAPMQSCCFTHYSSRIFVRTSSLTLDAMGVCARARVSQGSTRSGRPRGGRFSPLHASPARRCTRVRSPTDYDACSCAYVQPHSMQCVCACVQMVYIIVCANDNLLGVRFRPWPRPQRADAPEFVHPLIITHVRAHMFNHTRCNVCVYAMQCA